MTNNYAPCFNRIDFVVIPSNIELPWLIKYNTRNIFLEKSYTKCGGETILRFFSKKSKLNISWINSVTFCSYSLFLLYGKLRAIEIN